jgi:signal transduction histidine kinase
MPADNSKPVREDQFIREGAVRVGDVEGTQETVRPRDRRHTFLLRLGDSLRASSDDTVLLQRAARLFGEHLGADRAFFGELNPERDLAIVHPDYARGGLTSLAGRFKLSDFPEAVDALAIGRPCHVPDVASSPLLSAGTRDACLSLGCASFFSVPLHRPGKVLNLSAVSDRPRRWTGAQIGLAQDVAQRTWTIVERVQAEAALRAANEQLEQRIRERTADVRALFARLVRGQEQERERVAREIHDQLGQQMSALRMNLDALISRTEHDDVLAAYTARTQHLAEQLDRSVDLLMWDLRPAAVDQLGLAAALRRLVSEWSERSGIAAEFDAVDTESLRLPRAAQANIYRVAQEALHNVLEHAGATQVAASLQRRDDDLILVVEDNGSGSTMPEHQASGGLGLLSMRERAALIGGTLDIESTTGHGTTVFARVPISGLADALRDS